MLLDGILVVIVAVAMFTGRKTGLFHTVFRFLSLAIAGICTAVFGESLRNWMLKLPICKEGVLKLTETVEKCIQNGKTELLGPFASFVTTGKTAAIVSGKIAETVLSAILFVLFILAVRLGIALLDKTVFNLPVVRPINRLLGMLLSGVFALFLLFLAIGILGSFGVFTGGEFMEAQLESSALVKYIYENNPVLSLFAGTKE